MVGATEGQSHVLVDEGVSRVSMDIRQLSEADTYTVTSPDGSPLEGFTGVETLASNADMNGVDLVGNWHDLLAWVPPVPGRYGIDSGRSPHLAFVRLQGGGTLKFWIESGMTGDHIEAGAPISFRVALTDYLGNPIEGAAISAALKRVFPEVGHEANTMEGWREVAGEPGIYELEMAEGLAVGAYGMAITAIQEERHFRRNLSVSVAVLSSEPAGNQAIEDAFALAWDEAAAEAPSPVVLDGTTSNATGGQSNVGEIDVSFPTDNAKPHLPVVLFLHGILSGPQIWTRPNGFLPQALSKGYRVATIQLHPNESAAYNATILQNSIPYILEEYDVKRLVIVAHSKGGVDSDVYMMTRGSEQARTAVTVASPLLGSPVASALLVVTPPLQPLLALFVPGGEPTGPGTIRMLLDLSRGVRSAFQHEYHNAHPADFRSFSFWGHDAHEGGGANFVFREVSGPWIKDFYSDPMWPLTYRLNDGVVAFPGTRRKSQAEYPLSARHPSTWLNHVNAHNADSMWGHVRNELQTADYDNTPSVPGELAGEPFQCTFRLWWTDESEFESGFEVQRRVDDGEFEAWRELEPNSTTGGAMTTVDESIEPEHTYRYRIRAFVEDPGDESRWSSGFAQGRPTITVPQTQNCDPQPRTVSFDVTVNQPEFRQDFEATVAMWATPPANDPSDPFQSIVPIDQDSHAQSYTFPNTILDGWGYDVEVHMASGLAECDVSGPNTSGTITGNVTGIRVNCTGDDTTYDMGASWVTTKPDGSNGSVTGEIHATVMPPPTSPGQSSASETTDFSGSSGSYISAELGRPAGWSYTITTQNIDGGTCEVHDGHGPITGDVDVQIECTQTESDAQYHLPYQWSVTPADGGSGDSVTADLEIDMDTGNSSHQVTRSVGGSNQGEGNVTVTHGWIYDAHLESVDGGSCEIDSGGSGEAIPAPGANILPPIVISCEEGDDDCEGEQCIPEPEPPQEPPQIPRTPGGDDDLPNQRHVLVQYPGEIDGGGGSCGATQFLGYDWITGPLGYPIPRAIFGVVCTISGLTDPVNEKVTDDDVANANAGETTVNGPVLKVVMHDPDPVALPIAAGEPLPLQAMATHDRNILAYHIYLDGELAEYYVPPANSTEFDLPVDSFDTSGLAPGWHTLDIIVIGIRPELPSGIRGTGMRTDFEIDAAPAPPTSCTNDHTGPDVSLLNPLDGSQGVVDEQTSLRARATDDGGSGVNRVEWFANGTNRIAIDDTASNDIYSAVWFPYAGEHDVVAKAYDECDNVSESSAHSVTVVPSMPDPDPDPDPNIPPSASFTYSCTDLDCDFDASGSSDSDGSISSYSWGFGDGNTASGAIVSHTFGTDGDYIVTLTVTDNDGDSDSSGQTVSAAGSGGGSGPGDPDPSDPPPTCSVAPTVTITLPEEGSLEGVNYPIAIEADAQDDGQVTKVEFFVDAAGHIGTDFEAPFTAEWTAPREPGIEGERFITARVYDDCPTPNTTLSVPRKIVVECQVCGGPLPPPLPPGT